MTRIKFPVLPAAFATLMLSASAVPVHAASWLRLGAVTSRPYGHVDYCTRYAADCGPRKPRGALPAANLSVLSQVNLAVNRAIAPVSDQDQYGRAEVWSADAVAGDCEDYALAKRVRLMRMGYHPEDLLLAMTYTGSEYHTVLVVRSRAGDFVLDNMRDDVVPVAASRLDFIKVQSPEHGANWLAVTGTTHTAPRHAAS
ncbi:transglutaminase-like cysteine peptidase [Hoeflea olei]|uniref:Transglutaminase n=1 Tax=Hoeflea olei TaxID=1480615 RepID=A0A1C1YWJ9_9HYPH|nr:transglutaminase-like cysteine peptidase [Hoeflea olei]OCW57799.1 hypothetical protein AWJ14_03105 [Hoeflea olei]